MSNSMGYKNAKLKYFMASNTAHQRVMFFRAIVPKIIVLIIGLSKT
jgi:hypothetical protein